MHFAVTLQWLCSQRELKWGGVRKYLQMEWVGAECSLLIKYTYCRLHFLFICCVCFFFFLFFFCWSLLFIAVNIQGERMKCVIVCSITGMLALLGLLRYWNSALKRRLSEAALIWSELCPFTTGGCSDMHILKRREINWIKLPVSPAFVFISLQLAKKVLICSPLHISLLLAQGSRGMKPLHI